MRARVALVFAALAACGEPREPAPAAGSATAAAPASAAAPAPAADAGPAADAATAAAPDAASAPATLDDALARLRAAGFGDAADVIARRAAQAKPKMKLTEADALDAAIALLDLADDDAFRALHAVMPRSTVELARAVRTRGVPLADAQAIAAYLVRFTDALDFARLATFDENHSHVTGRRWHEIDYTGEGMTWQGQRDHWRPRGVEDFRTAASIHAYFVGAERLPHWRRVYRPRGKVADAPPP